MAAGKDEMQHHTISNTYVTRRTVLKSASAAGLAAIFAAYGVQPIEAHTTTAYPRLIVTAKDYGFELPASIPAGYTEITLRNEGAAEHHAMFMRLNPGKIAAEFISTAKNKDLGALFAMSSSAGGPGSIDRGHESTAIINLTAGEYVVICIVPDDQGMPHYKMGMLAPLTVTATAETGHSPAAETTIDLVDFGFDDLPKQIHSGKHIWKVVDTSAQLHEMILSRLAPGVSFEQAKAILMTPPPAAASASTSPAPVKSAPFSAVAGIAPMSPGAINWAVLDLTDGDYFAICFVPDTKTGKPHFELGMIAPFTVKS